MALLEMVVKEIPYQKGQKPWTMSLQRDTRTDDLIVSVNGAGGALKAKFRVSYSQFIQALANIT